MLGNNLSFLIFGLGGVFNNIGEAISQGIRWLFYTINTLIYRLIIVLYQLFEYLCNARLLDSEIIGQLSKRVGVVLGIVMLFMVLFSFIQMLLDPDKTNDKEMGMGAIVKKCLLVIVMLGTSTFFFDALYTVQRFVIGEKILYKLILPDSSSVDEDTLTELFGGVLAARTFGIFYTVNETLVAGESTEAANCVNFRNLLLTDIIYHNDFMSGNYCLMAYGTVEKEMTGGVTEEFSSYVMDYDFLLQTVVGVVLVYLLVSYVIKVGVRVIQLTVLQIISPMAIISYLSPKKDSMFSRWWNVYFSTYIDAFIRIAIIYFIIYLSSLILDSMDSSNFSVFWNSIGNPTDSLTRNYFTIAMIISLLYFAKKAPDLIKELIPSKGGLGFGGGISMKDLAGSKLITGTAKKGIGTVAGIGTGAAVGLITGGIGGAIVGYKGKGLLGGIGHGITGTIGGITGGAFRGGRAGFKSKGLGSAISEAHKRQAEVSRRNRDIIANGGSWGGSHIASTQETWKFKTKYDRLEGEYNQAQDYVSSYSAAKKKADGEVDKFASNYKFRNDKGQEFSLLELDKMRNDEVDYDAESRALFDDIYNKIHGFARDQAMNNYGAVKQGNLIWEDKYGGDWKKIEESVSTAGKIEYATNSEIFAHMTKVLSSDQAKSTSGTNFQKAKAANDFYEAKVNNKINDDELKKAKANAGK